MKVSIVITPDGRAMLLELAAKLRAEGIEIPPLSDVDFEQHRHDREGVACRERVCHHH